MLLDREQVWIGSMPRCAQIAEITMKSILVASIIIASFCICSSAPTVCFVIRTFHGQGVDEGNGYLAKLIEALKLQTSPRWVARFVVLESRPFSELRRMLKGYKDDRLSIYGEWIGHQYKAQPKGSLGFGPDYIGKLYNLSDDAIRHGCPYDSQYAVVTNGDNLYDSRFVAEIEQAAAKGADIVAFDYYSRFQRPTANPCDRFAWSSEAPLCKENKLRACQTDLSATAFRLSRLRSEDRYFGRLSHLTPSVGSVDHNDGILSSVLVKEGWKVHRAAGKCWVHHTHNPQQCAFENKVWDDAFFWHEGTYGGFCSDLDEVKGKLQAKGGRLELVLINATFDPDSWPFNTKGTKELKLKCMRIIESHKRWKNIEAFGRVCAADMDYAALPSTLPDHPWDSRNSNISGAAASGEAKSEL